MTKYKNTDVPTSPITHLNFAKKKITMHNTVILWDDYMANCVCCTLMRRWVVCKCCGFSSPGLLAGQEIVRSGMKLRKPIQIGTLIYIPLCLDLLCPLCPVGPEQIISPNWKQKTETNLKICSSWLNKNKQTAIDKNELYRALGLIFSLNWILVASFLTVCLYLIQTRCLAK